MHEMKDIVLFGKEAVARGTEAASFALQQPFGGSGLKPQLTNHRGEVMPSSIFPYMHAYSLGVTGSLPFAPDINRDTVRDLITMISKRTSGDQSPVSIAHIKGGTAQAKFLGCVVGSANMGYSTSGSPDASAILQGDMSFETMKVAAASGFSAGTPAVARHFLLPKATFTLNGVAATKILSYRRSWTIQHSLGPPTGADPAMRMYLEDGMLQEQVDIVAQFTAVAWETLLLAGTKFAASVIHATGTANETFTETMAEVDMETHQLGSQEGVLTEQITIKPGHDFTNIPTVWTYGSAIGSSVLSL